MRNVMPAAHKERPTASKPFWNWGCSTAQIRSLLHVTVGRVDDRSNRALFVYCRGEVAIHSFIVIVK